MKRNDDNPDANESMFICVLIAIIVLGWAQQNIRVDLHLLDARVTNIEAAK